MALFNGRSRIVQRFWRLRVTILQAFQPTGGPLFRNILHPKERVQHGINFAFTRSWKPQGGPLPAHLNLPNFPSLGDNLSSIAQTVWHGASLMGFFNYPIIALGLFYLKRWVLLECGAATTTKVLIDVVRGGVQFLIGSNIWHSLVAGLLDTLFICILNRTMGGEWGFLYTLSLSTMQGSTTIYRACPSTQVSIPMREAPKSMWYVKNRTTFWMRYWF